MVTDRGSGLVTGVFVGILAALFIVGTAIVMYAGRSGNGKELSEEGASG